MARRKVGFVVYSVELARADHERIYKVVRQVPPPFIPDTARAEMPADQFEDRFRGGYVKAFERDHLDGSASWGHRTEALVLRTLEEAIALALLCSEHEGAGTCVVMDAQTMQRVDSATWKPRRPSHRDSVLSRVRAGVKARAAAEKAHKATHLRARRRR